MRQSGTVRTLNKLALVSETRSDRRITVYVIFIKKKDIMPVII